MPIGTDLFTLAMPPKCGCSWVLAALPAAGIVLPRRSNAHILDPGCVNGLPSVTVQRSPDSMLLSYWLNRDKLGAARVEPIDRLIQLTKRFGGFREFLEDYLENHGGLLKEIRQLYASDYTANTDSIGPDLAEIFSGIGVVFDSDVLRSYPKANETAAKPRWPRGMKQRVKETEA